MKPEDRSASERPAQAAGIPRSVSDLFIYLQMARWVWWVLILKITELADTVIFVLRKKHDQASFLHVYHHTATLLLAWISCKYAPGTHCRNNSNNRSDSARASGSWGSLNRTNARDTIGQEIEHVQLRSDPNIREFALAPCSRPTAMNNCLK
jgi:hypothetical protein